MFSYELIYQAALEATSKKDLEEKLEKLAKKHPDFFIEARGVPDRKTGIAFTAASRLAFELASKGNPRDYKKVGWLCQLGADPSEAAKGFALAGAEKMVNYYHKTYEVPPELIIYAFLIGQKDKGLQLANSYIITYDVSPIVQAQAFAFAGEKSKLAQLYERHKKQDDVDITELTKNICFQAALGGNQDLARQYLKQYLEINPKGENLIMPYLVKGTALNGDDNTVNKFLEPKGKNSRGQSFLNLLNAAAQGYAQGGFHQQVQDLCERFPLLLNPKIVAQGYLDAKNKPKAEEFDLEMILDSYLKDRGSIVDDNNKVKEYKGLPFPFFQKSYQEKVDAIYNLKQALGLEPFDDGFDLMSHLSTLRNGNLGKAIRKYVKEGRADHFFIDKKTGALLTGPEFEKIDTVTKFITALAEKIRRDELESDSSAIPGG